MVSWDDAKTPSGGGQRREIERLKFPEGPTRVRLLGDVTPRYVYWVTTKEGKKNPVECLSYDRETQSFNDSKDDPIKEISEEALGGQELKPQFAFVCNAIDRGDGKIKIFDLKSTIFRQIVDIAKNPDYGNPADDKDGFDITITKEKTGPLPQNVKYTVMPGRNNTPLTEEEKKLELYDLTKMHKVPTYEEQKEWLMKNTYYFAGDNSEFEPETAEDLT